MATKKAKPIVPAVVNKREKSASEKLDDLGIEAFCNLILEGQSFRGISAMLGVGIGSISDWLARNPERSHAYAHARTEAAQTYDEIAVELIDQASDQFALAKAKELAVHYRWRAKAVNPQKYGDKLGVGGADGLPPIDVSLKVSFVSPG